MAAGAWTERSAIALGCLQDYGCQVQPSKPSLEGHSEGIASMDLAAAGQISLTLQDGVSPCRPSIEWQTGNRLPLFPSLYARCSRVLLCLIAARYAAKRNDAHPVGAYPPPRRGKLDHAARNVARCFGCLVYGVSSGLNPLAGLIKGLTELSNAPDESVAA